VSKREKTKLYTENIDFATRTPHKQESGGKRGVRKDKQSLPDW